MTTRCPKSALDPTGVVPCESCQEVGRKIDLHVKSGQHLCRVCSKMARCDCCLRRVHRVALQPPPRRWKFLCLACNRAPRPVGPLPPLL
jgi:hypothetical protein